MTTQIKIGNASFNVEACAKMSREEFVTAHRRGANYDVNEAYDKILAEAGKKESEEYNGNSIEPGKESDQAERKSNHEGDFKKPRGKGKDHSAKYSGSVIPTGD